MNSSGIPLKLSLFSAMNYTVSPIFSIICDPELSLTLPVTCSTTTKTYRRTGALLSQQQHSDTPPSAYTDILQEALSGLALCLSISTHISFSTTLSYLSVFQDLYSATLCVFVCVCVLSSVDCSNSETADHVLVCFLQRTLSQNFKWYRQFHRLIFQTEMLQSHDRSK